MMKRMLFIRCFSPPSHKVTKKNFVFFVAIKDFFVPFVSLCPDVFSEGSW